MLFFKYVHTYITQPCKGFANMMAPGASESILRTEHESETFHHVRFSSKRGLKPLKNSVFDHI